jgi:hypothetical protein
MGYNLEQNLKDFQPERHRWFGRACLEPAERLTIDSLLLYFIALLCKAELVEALLSDSAYYFNCCHPWP